MTNHFLRSVSFLASMAVVLMKTSPLPETANFWHFPAVYNFGDSNSDTGGLSAAFGPTPTPNGQTFFHHPAGRYCDGRLIIDFIANKVGLRLLNAYLDSIGSNFTQGVNFATAGSTIRPQNTTLRESGFSPISLDVQWNQFHQFRNRSPIFHATGGVFAMLLPKPEDLSKSLFTFDIGQNDLVSGYLSNMSTPQVRASVPDIVNQFKNIIKYIYGEGGRYFWIHNTGPFGCLAYVLERVAVLAPPLDDAGCSVPFNDVARYFNSELKKMVESLRTKLPSAQLVYVDIYTVKYELTSRAKEYGFAENIKACCGYGGKYNFNKDVGCGAREMKDGHEIVMAPPCSNPNEYINWDGVHYTEAANKWVFRRIIDCQFCDPPLGFTSYL